MNLEFGIVGNHIKPGYVTKIKDGNIFNVDRVEMLDRGDSEAMHFLFFIYKNKNISEADGKILAMAKKKDIFIIGICETIEDAISSELRNVVDSILVAPDTNPLTPLKIVVSLQATVSYYNVIRCDFIDLLEILREMHFGRCYFNEDFSKPDAVKGLLEKYHLDNEQTFMQAVLLLKQKDSSTALNQIFEYGSSVEKILHSDASFLLTGTLQDVDDLPAAFLVLGI